MAVRLHYLSHDLEIPPGQFSIGRSPDCQLSLDDDLVSRRHALLSVVGDAVAIEDLGSRNGVLVNGVKIQGPFAVTDGDEITIGSQKLRIFGVRTAAGRPVPPLPPRPVRVAETMMSLEDLRPDADENTRHGRTGRGPVGAPAEHPDKRVHVLSLVGSLADKAIAMGRLEDAEKLIDRPLKALLERAEQGDDAQVEAVTAATTYALKLARGLEKGEWVDFTLRLYIALEQLMPPKLVDDLYEVVRHVRVDKALLGTYLGLLSEKAPGFGPNERFLQHRVQGLEALARLK